MKLDRRAFAILVVGALSLCAIDAFAGVPPLPPGARPPAGYGWCPRCEGRRYVPSGFLGWTSKVCPNCRGTGMIALPPPPPPPPPPKPVVVPHHHHKPAPVAHPHHGHGAKPHGQQPGGHHQQPGGMQPRR